MTERFEVIAIEAVGMACKSANSLMTVRRNVRGIRTRILLRGSTVPYYSQVLLAGRIQVRDCNIGMLLILLPHCSCCSSMS